MAAIAALSPSESAASIQRLKYDWLRRGHDISSFHASEDAQIIRDSVFWTIENLDNVRAHVIYGKKELTFNHLKNSADFYSIFARAIINYMIKVYATEKYEQVVVVFDQALNGKKAKLFNLSVKPYLKDLSKPFYLYFHSMQSDSNGQIADYVAWSKYVELTRNEKRPWDALKNSINPSEFNIFNKERDVKNDHPD